MGGQEGYLPLTVGLGITLPHLTQPQDTSGFRLEAPSCSQHVCLHIESMNSFIPGIKASHSYWQQGYLPLTVGLRITFHYLTQYWALKVLRRELSSQHTLGHPHTLNVYAYTLKAWIPITQESWLLIRTGRKDVSPCCRTQDQSPLPHTAQGTPGLHLKSPSYPQYVCLHIKGMDSHHPGIKALYICWQEGLL